MTSVKYTGMAYKSADDMVMGTALHPVSEGFGLKIGAGQVVPEINYAPRPGTEKDPAKLRKEYVDYITTDILNRAVTAGFPAVHLETEWVSQMNQEKLCAPVVAGQKEVCEKFHEEWNKVATFDNGFAFHSDEFEGVKEGWAINFSVWKLSA